MASTQQQFTPNAYDTLIYARYPEAEAQARQDYDAACVAEENEQQRYDDALSTLIVLFESNQPSATIRLQKVVIELDRKALRRARSEREAAEHRLSDVQRRQSAGTL